MKVSARSSPLAILLIAGILSICLLTFAMLIDLQGAAGVIDIAWVAPTRLPVRSTPAAHIALGRNSADGLGLIGENFAPFEPVVVFYASARHAPPQTYITLTTAPASESGGFTVLLVNLPPTIPAQGWLVARGTTSGEVTAPIDYRADATPTPAVPSASAAPLRGVAAPASIVTVTAATATVVVTPTVDPEPVEGWFVQYYANRDLGGTPFVERNEYLTLDPADDSTAINTGTGQHGKWKCVCSMSTEHWPELRAEVRKGKFSARWTGRFYFPTTDSYRFLVRAADGVRIIVDDIIEINDWRSSARPRELFADVPLSEGYHKVQIEYFNARGQGTVRVDWFVDYSRWEGRYYNSTNLTGTVVFKRNDGAETGPLVFTAIESPGPGVNPDYFSVYWERKVYFKYSGTYRFYGRADDGARLYIDDAEVFRRWTQSPPELDVPGLPTATPAPSSDFAFNIYVRRGWHYIQVHYYELAGNADLVLAWEFTPTPAPEPTRVI